MEVATESAPPEPTTPPPPPRRRARARRPGAGAAVAIAYVSGIFVTAMDMHIVNVALPTLSRTFTSPLSDVQWTVIAYLLTLAVLIPASGWIGDRVGTKRTFLFALAVFTLASALCGLAQSLPELIAARALQGVGGGMLTPTGTAMLYRAYGPERRAEVTRTLIVPILVAPATAPILGGVLTQDLSWRWVFLVNVPVGVATILFGYLFLPEYRSQRSSRLDARRAAALRSRAQRSAVCDQPGIGAGAGSRGRSWSRASAVWSCSGRSHACRSGRPIPSSGCACSAIGCSGRRTWCSRSARACSWEVCT